MVIQALRAIRRALSVCASHIDRALESRIPVEPEEMLSSEEITRRARNEARKAARNSRKPWYYSRPEKLKIPDSLRYYEEIHGTKATIDMIRKRAEKKERSESDP